MDDLSPEQVEAQRKILVDLREEIAQVLEGAKSSARPVDLDQPIGRISRIDAIQQQQIAEATLRNYERRLGLVMAALNALDAGDYGVCRRCDMPIAPERLQARPEASLCIECALELERR